MTRPSWFTRLLRKLQPSRLSPTIAKRLEHVHARLDLLERHVDSIREALGRIESRQIANIAVAGLRDAEFRVFSQWNEDGIIQELLRRVPMEAESFVELGVESYQEANTRFLLLDRNWRGLVVDADVSGLDTLRRGRLRWRHDLAIANAFVTRENVNTLLREHDFTGSVGLLSIDLDGVDWWIWEALDVLSPALVVAEYNWRFGNEAAVTVPYRADFERRAAHPSLTYYGASLEALARLGRRKGYDLVGCESHGVNAFFVRSDLPRRDLPALTAREAYVEGRSLEMHDASGRRVETSREEEVRVANGLPLVAVDETGRAAS